MSAHRTIKHTFLTSRLAALTIATLLEVTFTIAVNVAAINSLLSPFQFHEVCQTGNKTSNLRRGAYAKCTSG